MKPWNWTFVVLPVIAGAVACAVTCCGSEQDASKDRLTLKYVECHQDSVGAGRGNDPSCLVSRDGRRVYATRYGEDALLVYQRAASTGKLRLIQRIQNPTPVSLPSRMQESFAGRHLYVLGGMPDSLSIWSRDAESGKLTLVGALSSDMFTGVPGIRGTMAIALSPDDRNVYVAGNIDHSLVVFQRDATTGRLAPLQLFQGRRHEQAGTSHVSEHGRPMALGDCPPGASISCRPCGQP
jgi:6-phosphogluconolactonase (cycloisomerase 2 family)